MEGLLSEDRIRTITQKYFGIMEFNGILSDPNKRAVLDYFERLEIERGLDFPIDFIEAQLKKAQPPISF